MKRLLIISPYFPPSNAADMQRVRMSLPYFREFGWKADVICVSQKYSDINKDPMLQQSISSDLDFYEVKAFSKKWTSKLGLGSIALRSLKFFLQMGNKLLKEKAYDLIYFSTTQFPVCILGAYWNKKFSIPYVIDMQDPWHSDYYLNKPKHERPPKYWFSYRLNKYLEPIAMSRVGGIISVSQIYIETLKHRYPTIRHIPTSTITFGAFPVDQKIVEDNLNTLTPPFKKEPGKLNLVYIGRGGKDMHKALSLLFSAFKEGLTLENSVFKKFNIHFIGTSYASKGLGKKTIHPLAEEFGIQDIVFEQSDRIPFYQGLAGLKYADGLIVPGSDDPGYTASKLYPYIISQKPLLGLFHEQSSAVEIVKKCNAGEMITLNAKSDTSFAKIEAFLISIVKGITPKTDWTAFQPYTAREMTKQQCIVFDQVIKIDKKK